MGYVHSSFSLGLRLLDPNIEDDRITNVPTRPVHAQFHTEIEKLVVFVSYISVHFTEALVIISSFSYHWSPLLYPQISPHIVKDYQLLVIMSFPVGPKPTPHLSETTAPS